MSREGCDGPVTVKMLPAKATITHDFPCGAKLHLIGVGDRFVVNVQERPGFDGEESHPGFCHGSLSDLKALRDKLNQMVEFFEAEQ